MSWLLTVKDVAQIMRCLEDKVIRVFARMDSVIDLGRPENLSRRRYRVLRIPKQVVERYLTTKAARSIHIEISRAEHRRRSPQWESRAILNLVKAGLQNGVRPDDARDKKTYRRICRSHTAFDVCPAEPLARGYLVRRGRLKKRLFNRQITATPSLRVTCTTFNGAPACILFIIDRESVDNRDIAGIVEFGAPLVC